MEPFSSKPTKTAFLLTGLAFLSGTFLYHISNGAIANIIWGPLYGLGFLIFSLFLKPLPGAGGAIYFFGGAFVWPAILTIGMLGVVDRMLRSGRSMKVIAVFVVSLLVLFPMKYAAQTFVYYLPIYGVFFENF